MHDRYDEPRITGIWGNNELLLGWQSVELAVMKARVDLGEMPQADYDLIEGALLSHPPNVRFWKKRDGKLNHDLNAFIEERLRFIPKDLQRWFHRLMTSYDTEESARQLHLMKSAVIVVEETRALMSVIKPQADKYRFAVMMKVTHGQWADPGTFGARLCGWYIELEEDLWALETAMRELHFSKLSGFVGNYTGITPELEEKALAILGLKPYIGATQIMPRTKALSLASAILRLSKTLTNIATAIRLGARSAGLIYQEPFKKGQKGSSAGPQKRNPITSEKTCGLDDLITGFHLALSNAAETWEERDIAQSCVERVAWRDIFHATIHELKQVAKVIRGLVVYPDKMMEEIVRTNGCYAANVAKEELKEWGAAYGLLAEDCYRMVQVAAFNLGYPLPDRGLPQSLEEADQLFAAMQARSLEPCPRGNIKEVLRRGQLQYTEMLAPSKTKIAKWNRILRKIFADPANDARWDEVFTLTYLLRNERVIYERVFDKPTDHQGLVA